MTLCTALFLSAWYGGTQKGEGYVPALRGAWSACVYTPHPRGHYLLPSQMYVAMGCRAFCFRKAPGEKWDLHQVHLIPMLASGSMLERRATQHGQSCDEEHAFLSLLDFPSGSCQGRLLWLGRPFAPPGSVSASFF